MMSREQLLLEARNGFYKPEILEKVCHLLETLSQIVSLPYLSDRLVLKGGTALNLFHFSSVPRLSVDIDLNYVGHLDRVKMLEERPIVNDAIAQILLSNQFELTRNPGYHAGGKMVWRYNSVLGQKGNLEIDLNYMYRQPLLPVHLMRPTMNQLANFECPVLDIHELAAGKLSALLSRVASRDLYDAHYLLTRMSLDEKKLRLAFVVYMAMTEINSEEITIDLVGYDLKDLHNRLLPVLRQKDYPRVRSELDVWAKNLLNELRDALSVVLPLKSNEEEFIRLIRDGGGILPELITDDVDLQKIIKNHPAVLWATKREKVR